ncbi:hypothetical protein CSIM01_07167 [Colletotrichum simmondsii]|uniref:Uncharacterized protein n=1 Tax=Colletotrichum simmondsii TaxID=703756 RepID=A0A135SE55_9PEZI|nr:hypothetical protein CSIM01_07167 [Colletotrichum simmondsii]
MPPGHFASSLENSWLLTWTKSIPPFAALQRYNFFELYRQPQNPAVEGRCALKAGPSCLSAWLDQPNALVDYRPLPSVTKDKQNPGLDLAKTVGPPAISAIAVTRLLPIQPTLADGGWRLASGACLALPRLRVRGLFRVSERPAAPLHAVVCFFSPSASKFTSRPNPREPNGRRLALDT